jgi:hypothetical protein
MILDPDAMDPLLKPIFALPLLTLAVTILLIAVLFLLRKTPALPGSRSGSPSDSVSVCKRSFGTASSDEMTKKTVERLFN